MQGQRALKILGPKRNACLLKYSFRVSDLFIRKLCFPLKCFDSVFWNNVHTKEEFPRGCSNHICRDEWKLKGPRRALETETHDLCKILLSCSSPPAALEGAYLWLPETERKSSTEVMSSTASVSTRTCFSHWSLKTSMLSWATLLCGRAASVRAALMTYLLETIQKHTDYTIQKRNKMVKGHIETLDPVASTGKWVLSVQKTIKNMKDKVHYHSH